jgi:hypothetical protein
MCDTKTEDTAKCELEQAKPPKHRQGLRSVTEIREPGMQLPSIGTGH